MKRTKDYWRGNSTLQRVRPSLSFAIQVTIQNMPIGKFLSVHPNDKKVSIMMQNDFQQLLTGSFGNSKKVEHVKKLQILVGRF